MVEKYANTNILSFKKWKFDVFFSDPINTFSCSYKTDNEPIRISYHRNTHYNSIVDPYKATIGVGLGLPGLQPEVSTHYNSIVDPYKATIGVGLGLPGLQPGVSCTFFVVDYCGTRMAKPTCRDQSSQNSSVLSDMTSKIWVDFAEDWHKIGILQ